MRMILVTGGAGFIGSHVVDAYIAAGHEVGVMDNLSTGREENVNQAAKLHRVDVTNRAQVHAAIASFKPEVVNHHAAQSEVPKSVADPGHDALVNVVGGLNVLRACVDEAVRKVIFSSTGGALYGEPDIVPADEDHPVRPLSPYGTSKLAFEHYLGMFDRTFGLRYTTLRYAAALATCLHQSLAIAATSLDVESGESVVTAKVTLLVVVPPAALSSFDATVVRAETLVPVYTPSSVSKLLPSVSIVTVPLVGAVQVHHTLLPPVLPPWFGSPASLVAPTFVPLTVIEGPMIVVALANASLLAAPNPWTRTAPCSSAPTMAASNASSAAMSPM